MNEAIILTTTPQRAAALAALGEDAEAGQLVDLGALGAVEGVWPQPFVAVLVNDMHTIMLEPLERDT